MDTDRANQKYSYDNVNQGNYAGLAHDLGQWVSFKLTHYRSSRGAKGAEGDGQGIINAASASQKDGTAR
jgi:hypothetical protein